MAQERVLHEEATDLATYEVTIDGEVMSTELVVFSLIVQKAVNKIAWAKLVLKDGDPATEDFEKSSSGQFAPGAEVEVKLGYHGEDETVFKGIIVKHGIKIRKRQSPVLVVEMKDAAVKLTVGKKSSYHYDQSDTDIISELASEVGLDTDMDDTDVTHARMVRFRSTDWEFICYRAEANGRMIYVNDGELAVKKPDLSAEPAVSLLYGATLLEFEGEIDARNQFEGVTASSWDLANQEVIEGEGADPGYEEQGATTADDLVAAVEAGIIEVKHSGSLSTDELQAWADGQLLRSRMSKVQGRAVCKGIATVKPGDVVEFGGVGEQFNGKAFVSAVRHSFDLNIWNTHIQFGLSAEQHHQKVHVQPELAGGLLPSIGGLQVGVVKALEGDPDGEHRVQVYMPMIDPDEDGTWARVATLDAGDGRGTFFLPELEDEVIMGFVNDDPRDPVILGMLNSSAKPAPLEASDDNNEKGIITREALKVLFDDDKKSIHLETPNGNVATLSDDEGSIVIEDENGNKVELSGDGISMADANGNSVLLNSDGITLDSAADVNITATGDVNVAGVNIANVADAEFVAEGNAGAKLSSGAMAVIEGGVVMIN